MAGLKELRTRIETIKSTQKITSAMKMVAASSLRKAQGLIASSVPYRENNLSPQENVVSEFRTLEKNGQRIKLTQVEYSIMRMFMENPGKALSREEILDLVWGRDYFGELKIVDVNVRRLRLKIEDSPTSPTYINTVWGYGYKWGF